VTLLVLGAGATVVGRKRTSSARASIDTRRWGGR
jgi:hypothetical protein